MMPCAYAPPNSNKYRSALERRRSFGEWEFYWMYKLMKYVFYNDCSLQSLLLYIDIQHYIPIQENIYNHVVDTKHWYVYDHVSHIKVECKMMVT